MGKKSRDKGAAERTKQQRREASIRAAATLIERRRAQRHTRLIIERHAETVQTLEAQIKILAAEVKRATGKVWGGTIGGAPVWVDEQVSDGMGGGAVWIVTDDSMTRCADG